MRTAPISFRSSRIVYYGPHPCVNCGVPIVKMGAEWGGNSFNYPEGTVYPNTEWHVHVCSRPGPGNSNENLHKAGVIQRFGPGTRAFYSTSLGSWVIRDPKGQDLFMHSYTSNSTEQEAWDHVFAELDKQALENIRARGEDPK